MRPDLEIIQQWIQPNSKVLDLVSGLQELAGLLIDEVL